MAASLHNHPRLAAGFQPGMGGFQPFNSAFSGIFQPHWPWRAAFFTEPSSFPTAAPFCLSAHFTNPHPPGSGFTPAGQGQPSCFSPGMAPASTSLGRPQHIYTVFTLFLHRIYRRTQPVIHRLIIFFHKPSTESCVQYTAWPLTRLDSAPVRHWIMVFTHMICTGFATVFHRI